MKRLFQLFLPQIYCSWLNRINQCVYGKIFYDRAHGCQGQPATSQYGTRGSGGKMKHLHHLETGVMSVTLCCLLWKIMRARILTFFSESKLWEYFSVFTRGTVSSEGKYDQCQSTWSFSVTQEKRVRPPTPLLTAVCCLHGKHVKLMGYLYPKCKAQRGDRVHLWKSCLKGRLSGHTERHCFLYERFKRLFIYLFWKLCCIRVGRGPKVSLEVNAHLQSCPRFFTAKPI